MSGFPMDCVFCAIAGGREPAHRLFEDEHFIVLLDIFPLRPAHVLIVAREHAPHLSDLSAAARVFIGTGFTKRDTPFGLFLMWVGVICMLAIISYRIYIATHY